MGQHYNLKEKRHDKETYTTKNHGMLGGICHTPGSLQKQLCHLPE